MRHPHGDHSFGTSIAHVYERDLVPLIFEPYAAVLAQRVAEMRPARVLEIAAGTGAVTRALSSRLPESTAITATDLNRAMLERAIVGGTRHRVEWCQADALALPFGDASFDAVVCQFGAMFFPDKGRAYSEARRVLAPGGTFFFSVWDHVEENEFADVVAGALASLFPLDPPSFMQRTPHGYSDRPTIEADLRSAGFSAPTSFTTVAERSRAATPMLAAVAYCEGTPLRNEIEARDRTRLGEATRLATEALRRRFGSGPIDGKMQAHIVAVAR